MTERTSDTASGADDLIERHRWNSDRQNGEAIRGRREDARLTRAAVAHHMKVETRTLARWELEGTTFEKLGRAFQAIEAMRLNMEGVTGRGLIVDLSKVSTTDLSEELVRRSRMMEERDRRLLEHKRDLERKGLGHHFPAGL